MDPKAIRFSSTKWADHQLNVCPLLRTESFDYCTSEKIEHRLSLLLSMSLILIWGMKLPVVRIARMGGQYAKPRSKQTEIVDGKEVMSFRSVTSP